MIIQEHRIKGSKDTHLTDARFFDAAVTRDGVYVRLTIGKRIYRLLEGEAERLGNDLRDAATEVITLRKHP
jgi:hypothetical protein